jgi:hypothetical protein
MSKIQVIITCILNQCLTKNAYKYNMRFEKQDPLQFNGDKTIYFCLYYIL